MLTCLRKNLQCIRVSCGKASWKWWITCFKIKRKPCQTYGIIGPFIGRSRYRISITERHGALLLAHIFINVVRFRPSVFIIVFTLRQTYHRTRRPILQNFFETEKSCHYIAIPYCRKWWDKNCLCSLIIRYFVGYVANYWIEPIELRVR